MKEKDQETLKQSQHKLTKKQLALIPEAEQYMYLIMNEVMQREAPRKI